MRKVLALLLSVVMTLTLLVSSAWADEPKPLDGKTVILHTNDVHGSIELYAKVAAMKGTYIPTPGSASLCKFLFNGLRLQIRSRISHSTR